MGFLSKLKNIFAKNIDCSKALDDVFFHLMPWVKVTVDSNLIVKDGFTALFVCKNKVTDILPSGKHKLNNNTIPYTFKRLKLYKIDKHGNMPKKFRCDIYFVSSAVVSNFEFVSNNPYIKKSNRFGRVIAYSEGECDMCIENPQKLIEYILLERAYIKDKVAIKDISAIIGNGVNEIMEKSGESFGNLIANVQNTNMLINANINNVLAFCGLRCQNLHLKLMRVNSRLQERIDEYIKTQREYNEQFASDNNAQINQSLNTTMVENSVLSGQESFSAFGENQSTSPAIDFTRLNKKQCHYCGKYINEKAKYCEYCGFDQDSVDK